MTHIYKFSSKTIDKELISTACQYLLRKGSVIALPTDTIYGLASRTSDSNALEKIYQIKERVHSKPLTVCIGDIQDIDKVALIPDSSNNIRNVLKQLLPGKVTVVLQRSPNLNPNLNSNLNLIGIRIPDDQFVRAICRRIGPISLTSANISGDISPISTEEFQSIWSKIDAIFDKGKLHNDNESHMRLGSTVIDLSKTGYYSILRNGCALLETTKIMAANSYKFTASNDAYYNDFDDDDFEPEIFHGESVVDRKSVFQGHCAKVYRYDHIKIMLEKLKENKKIENAFHNMYAYRIDKNDKDAMIVSKSANIDQDCDDDGEQAAGGRLLSLLEILNVVNVIVVVTRWYGGIQLGPARFKHINNAARDALVKAGFVKDNSASSNDASSSNSKSKKSGKKKK